MAYFSNGDEGRQYQARYCFTCKYWVGDVDRIGSDRGCPIWLLHELHVGEPAWQPTLDRLIPMVPKAIHGVRHAFAGPCATYWQKEEAP